MPLFEIPSFGLPDFNLPTFLASLIRTALGFVGFMFLLQIMWTGFKLMTSGGYEEAHKKAYAGLKSSIIGLIIIVCSSSITTFVVETISKASGLALR